MCRTIQQTHSSHSYPSLRAKRCINPLLSAMCRLFVRVKNGATADKTDFEQIRADLRRTWRRSKDYVAMAMMLLQDAPKIYNHEARLSFLLGTHHRVGCDSLIRKLSLGTKERKSEVQNIVSEIFAFLPGGDHER